MIKIDLLLENFFAISANKVEMEKSESFFPPNPKTFRFY